VGEFLILECMRFMLLQPVLHLFIFQC
jgi:hypothetical protein